ncbi:VirB/Tra/Trw family protein [Escherichia coli M056]|nr:VirB/Tra/Trw family protein [Escherichia coli M056]
MKNKRAICVVLCAALGLAACSSPPKLTQPKGEWVNANPSVSVQLQGGR